MSDEWLDRWATIRRLPATFRAARAWATRKGRADDPPLHSRAREAEPRNRIAKPKMTWQETVAWLKASAERAEQRKKDGTENRTDAIMPTYRNRGRRMGKLLRRMGDTCRYCGETMTLENGRHHPRAPSRDHIVPLARGGGDLPENMTLACRDCNERKGNLDGEEFRAVEAGRATSLAKWWHRRRVLGLEPVCPSNRELMRWRRRMRELPRYIDIPHAANHHAARVDCGA